MGFSSLTHFLRRAFSTSAARSPGGIKTLVRDIFLTQNPNKLATNFLKSSEVDVFRKKASVYEEVVRRLSASGRFDLVEQVLEHQKKYDDVSTEGFCVRLITLYGRSRMLGHAVKVFDEMPQFKSARTVKSLNALLAACVNSKQYSKAEALFCELPQKLGVQPDVISHNTVIKAFCEMGSLDSAVSMLDEMEKRECKPDVFTFNTLLNGLYEGNRFSDGEKMWVKMLEHGVVPDIRSYNAKLVGLISEKKTQQAVDLLEEMKGKELNPDLFSYNLLIKGFCNEGNLVEAKRLYDEMRGNRCKPQKVTYATLLSFAVEKGDLDVAFELCKKAFRDRCLVDGVLLQRVVDELVKCSRVKEAVEVVVLGKSNKYCDYKLKLNSTAQ